MTKDEFFKRYEIDIRNGRLGGGAFGTVYRAYDHITDQEKAIKVAEVKYINGKEFSLQAEFDATKDLPVHKNIANYEAVYQFQMPNGLFDYAVMQYYPDGNLKELLSNTSLNQDSKCEIIDGIFAGIGYLHDHNILHRDIKPSNILISKRGGKYTPKIADFGLSKLVSSNDMEAITNSFGGGTLEYSAPEQLLGQDLRFNADLWSAGVIAYEMLLGNIPFISNDITGSADAKRRIIYQNIVNAPIPADIVQCPSPYDRMILACLYKDPAVRVQSFHDIQAIREDKDAALEYEVNDETLVLSEADRKAILGKVQDPSNEETWIDTKNTTAKEKKFSKKFLMIGLGTLLLLFGIYAVQSMVNNSDNSDTPEDMSIDAELLKEENKDIEAQRLIRQKQEDKIWEITKADGSLEAYEEYKVLYPNGRYVKEVEELISKKLQELRSKDESAALEIAKQSKSISAFKAFIESFPDSKKRDEAEAEISRLEKKAEADFWSSTLRENTIEAYQEFLKAYPQSVYSNEANSKIQMLFKDRLLIRAYNKAIKINTVKGYDDFLKSHSKSRFDADIQKRKKQLSNQNGKKTNSPNIQAKEEDQQNAGMVKTPKSISSKEAPMVTREDEKANDSEAGADKGIVEKSIDEKSLEVESSGIDEKETAGDEKEKEVKIVKSPEVPKEKVLDVPPFVSSLEANMVSITGASYKLGCDEGCDDDAMPSKTIQILPFKMQKYEVTQAEWKSIMGSNPSYFDDCNSCPVESVSFDMVQEYISRLNALPGNPFTYRLPTEGEWECAASAGTKFKFAGSNDVEDVAVYRSTSNNGTKRGGTEKSNRLVIFDMSGNVAEWCDSWYNENGFSVPAKKEQRVIRGGHWRSKASSCEIKKRDKAYPNDKKSTIGVRLVRSY